jgi:hypothetical protein
MTANHIWFERSEPGWKDEDEDGPGGFGDANSDIQDITDRQELGPAAETFGAPARVAEELQSTSSGRMSIDSRVRFLRRDSTNTQNGMSETEDRLQDQQTVQQVAGRQRKGESSGYPGSRKHRRSPSPEFQRVIFDKVQEIQRSQVPMKEPPSFKIR